MPSPSYSSAALVLLLLSSAACGKKETARADSLEVRLTEQQQLSNQLAAQKDSLVRVVLDADAFLGSMDSAISTVKGLPRNRRRATDPLAEQLQARKDMQTRVHALVTRAKETSAKLAELQANQIQLQSQNEALRLQLADAAAKIESDAQLIADLGATIERQNLQIATLERRLDSLGTEIRVLGTRHYRAYYVVGTEKELLEKGVVTKEGGANLLLVRAGRTLVPARVLDPEDFVAIDQREDKTIQIPDSTKKYRIVSRHSLDAADVAWRDRTSFRGDLKILNPDEFWAPSRYLIVLKQ